MGWRHGGGWLEHVTRYFARDVARSTARLFAPPSGASSYGETRPYEADDWAVDDLPTMGVDPHDSFDYEGAAAELPTMDVDRYDSFDFDVDVLPDDFLAPDIDDLDLGGDDLDDWTAFDLEDP